MSNVIGNLEMVSFFVTSFFVSTINHFKLTLLSYILGTLFAIALYYCPYVLFTYFIPLIEQFSINTIFSYLSKKRKFFFLLSRFMSISYHFHSSFEPCHSCQCPLVAIIGFIAHQLTGKIVSPKLPLVAAKLILPEYVHFNFTFLIFSEYPIF